MKESKITLDQYLKEIDKYRTGYGKMTEDQETFILKSRSGDRPVPYRTMAEMWEQFGWGNMTKATLLSRHDSLINKLNGKPRCAPKKK